MDTPSIELLKSNHKKSIKEVVIRILWYLLWKSLASWTPRFCNVWRIFLLRSFGAKIGTKVLVLGGVWVDMPWNLEIGDFSAIGSNVWIYNFAQVTIGRNTVVSQNTTLCTASHDYSHPHMTLYWKPITIENQVWVAADCFVMPNVVIREGAVIGARSVVTKDMPEWMICAGNPCKPLKTRVIQ